MSQYPAPTYTSGRYSPGRPAYTDTRPPFPPSLPVAPTAARDYPPFPYSAPAMPPAQYRPYDPYSNDARPAPTTAYPQPRDPYAADSYDPYSPSTAYNPPSAPLPMNPARYEPSSPRNELPPRPNVNLSPPRRSSQPNREPKSSDGPDLPLLTPPVSVNISGFTTAVYSLPPSHLPLEKYVAVNPGDCIDIHRALCRKSIAVWYADGCSRAGEGWSAAIEWVIDNGQSGRKMRGCIPGGDGLDSELGAICKVVEGFQELLHISLKEGNPMSHELVVFCDSAAAIVGIDTSSRPEALRFESLWRDVCSEFIQAKMILVWLPKNSGIEGHVLADKIAMVAASNSYLKRKKENTLAEVYKRPAGGDSMPSGSAEAGAWQRGDADPSRRKIPFERPKAIPLSPPKPATPIVPAELEGQAAPSREAIFVTSFPPTLSAKDLGILFGQFGTLTSVDIYNMGPRQPRFAYVQFTNTPSGDAAIAALNGRSIEFGNAYARENAAELADWNGWTGHMTVIRNEDGKLIPSLVQHLFPDMSGGHDNVSAASEESATARKRGRSVDAEIPAPVPSSASSIVDSPTPSKRPRQESTAQSPSASSIKIEPNTLVVPPERGDSQTLRHDRTPPQAHTQPTGANGATLPPTPQTAERRPSLVSTAPPAPPSILQEALPTPITASSPATSAKSAPGRLTNSAAEPQEHPIRLSVRTLQSQIQLVKKTFSKHDPNNWIAHSCLIAVDLDQARRALQADLFATDEGFITGRELEQQLAAKEYTPARINAFITKVLKVLDGIAMAESLDAGLDGSNAEPAGGVVEQARRQAETELEAALSKYPDQTCEAIRSAGIMLEYLNRGKDLQEKKRLDVERRVKVLEGMVQIGEVVGGVVRFLLSENSG